MPIIAGEALETHDWEAQYHEPGHPVCMIANRTQLLEKKTGVVLAETKPGYEWYWRHDHPHICEEGWSVRKMAGWAE